MRIKRIVHFIVFLLVFILATPMNAKNNDSGGIKKIPLFVSQSKKEKNYREGEVLIKYKEKNIRLETEKGRKKAGSFLEKEKLEKLDEIKELNLQLLRSSEKTEKLVSRLKNNSDIEFVEPNYLRHPEATPNDPFFPNSWGLNNTGQTVNGKAGTADADIDAPEAWDGEQDANSTITVAIIDTGVEYAHPDLAGNMWDGSSCKDEFNNPIAGGCPNHGWNYESDNNDPNDTGHADPAYDGHGTMVAGVIGAVSNNSAGISGLSIKNKLKIMALRFGFDTFSEIKAINFAKNNGAKVINASFVGDTPSDLEKNAIESFPGIFVAAAGNGGADQIGDNNDTTPQYPCGYSPSNIICVAATDQNDQLTSFSNYGTASVDIAAPGENIISAYQSAYAYADGTSFATPYVSGIAGMLYSFKPASTQTETRYALLNSGDQKSSLAGKLNSEKRANLKNALAMLMEISGKTPVYRFWSNQNRHHFYTASEEEKNLVITNYTDNEWLYEGIAYYAFLLQITNTAPVYRFWSPQNKSHFYTISEEEKNLVIANYTDNEWFYEGITYFAYPAQQPGTTPIHRFWSPQNRSHFYTASENEKDLTITNYTDDEWTYEGIACYVPTN